MRVHKRDPESKMVDVRMTSEEAKAMLDVLGTPEWGTIYHRAQKKIVGALQRVEFPAGSRVHPQVHEDAMSRR